MTPLEQLRALTPDNPNRGLTAYVPDTVDDARALKARGQFDPHFIRRNCYNDGIWHNHEQSAAKDFVRQSTEDEMQARPILDKDVYWDSTGTWSGDDALRKYADMARIRHIYPRQKVILGTGMPPVPSTSAKTENIGPAESCGTCGHSPESTHNVHCYTCDQCGEAWYCSNFCRKTQSHCYPDEDEQIDDEVVGATSEGVEEDISETKSSKNSQDDDGIATYLKELGEMQKQGQDKASGVRGSHPETPRNEGLESNFVETVEKTGKSPIVMNTIVVPMVHSVRFEKDKHRTIEYQITSPKQGNPHWVDGYDTVLQAPAWLAAINIFWQYSEKNASARKLLRYPEMHPEGLPRDPYWYHIAPSSFINEIVGCTVSADKRSLYYHCRRAGRRYGPKESDKIRAWDLEPDWDTALGQYWARYAYSVSRDNSAKLFLQGEAEKAEESRKRNDSVIGSMLVSENDEEDDGSVDSGYVDY